MDHGNATHLLKRLAKAQAVRAAHVPKWALAAKAQADETNPSA